MALVFGAAVHHLLRFMRGDCAVGALGVVDTRHGRGAGATDGRNTSPISRFTAF
jgi:hypothetical protein